MAEAPLSITHGGVSLLALGFRPFFLAAGLSAFLSMLLWLAMLRGLLPSNAYYSGTTWHAHELLFGYTVAVIAGFLLTATRNWTGMQTAQGAELGGLVLLWLAGRIAPFLPLPFAVIALIDLAFLPALAFSLFRPLWSGPNPVNRVFIGLMAAMTVASLLVHLHALGINMDTALAGDKMMLDLVILTLLIVSGRVMPFFTQGGIGGSKPKTRKWVESLTFGLMCLYVVVDPLLQWSQVTGGVALALATVQAIRLAGWYDRRVWSIPILAVLYTGYLWLVFGFLLSGLANLGLVAPFPALHALTVGAVAVITQGMMARVALGHTGREMRSAPLTNTAFIMLNAAALVRVLLPLLLPAHYALWLDLSGGLWLLSFGLFLWVYGPILVTPRVDGRPG